MPYDNRHPNSKSDSNSVDADPNQTAAQIRKELDEKTVDLKNLVYNQGTPGHPREVIGNPAVVPETFADSHTPRSDQRHDDE